MKITNYIYVHMIAAILLHIQLSNMVVDPK